MNDQGHSDGVNIDQLSEAELSQVDGWMPQAAHADLRRVFLSAPSALRFLARNPQVVPGKIPQQLDAAGLLVRKDGKPWQIHYSRKATRPYGSAGLNPVD